jgi:hypothetical protein
MAFIMVWSLQLESRALSLIVVVAVILLYSLLPVAKSLSQEQSRVLEKWPSYSGEPLSLMTIKNRKGIIELDKIFSDDDNWFKELTVSVKNVSGKDITYVGIGLRFIRPENQSGEPPLGYTLSYGNRLAALKRLAPPIEFRSNLEHNGIDIKLLDHEYDSIKTMLEKLGYPPHIKKINIYVEEVFFSDGTGWASGTWFKRHPNEPDKLIPIEQPQGGAPKRTAKLH